MNVSPSVFFFGGFQGFLAMLFALFGFIEALVFVDLLSFEQQQTTSLFAYRNSPCTGTGWPEYQYKQYKSYEDGSVHIPGVRHPQSMESDLHLIRQGDLK